jgi:transcriptional regulator with XRE-family HTH domain
MAKARVARRSPANDPKGIIGNDPFWIKENLLITIEQLRAARGLLGWSQSELAARAGLSLPTVKRVEADGRLRVSENARHKLQKALEAAGVEFIHENGGGPGVRLKKRQRKDTRT